MKKLVLFILMAAVLSTAVFAQVLLAADELNIWESPQNISTRGLFRSDADNFIRPDSFNTVEFEKWFGMISYRSNYDATLGYATKTGSGTFLGFFYSGSFWADIDQRKYTSSYNMWKDEEKSDVKSYDTTMPGIGNSQPNNQIAALIGLSNMGFRLSITSTYESFKDEEFLYDEDGNFNSGDELYYKYYQAVKGSIYPEIAWSLTENIIEKGIRPWAALGIRFHNDYEKSQQYEDDGTSFVAGNETVDHSLNQTDINLRLGLGGLTLSEKNDWKTVLDFEYHLTLPIYNNEYEKGGSDYKTIGKIKGYYGDPDGTSGPLPDGLFECKAGYHTLTPSLGTEWKGDKLSLKAKVNFNLNIRTSESTPKIDDDGSLKTDGTTAKEFQFNFTPIISLGMQWQVHPKLALNAGGRIGFNVITITNVKGDSYTMGSKDDNSSYDRTTTSFGNWFTNEFSVGATFNTGNNVFFEATAGISTTGSNDQIIDVFKTGSAGDDGGLFSFGSILVGLRF